MLYDDITSCVRLQSNVLYQYAALSHGMFSARAVAPEVGGAEGLRRSGAARRRGRRPAAGQEVGQMGRGVISNPFEYLLVNLSRFLFETILVYR